MNDDWIPPAPPAARRDAGAAWRELWKRAHRDMAPQGVGPAPYLIDCLLDPMKRDRWWLRDRFAEIAAATRVRAHDERQPDGALRWFVELPDPNDSPRVVRVVVNPRLNQIFNAFVDGAR